MKGDTNRKVEIIKSFKSHYVCKYVQLTDIVLDSNWDGNCGIMGLEKNSVISPELIIVSRSAF